MRSLGTGAGDSRPLQAAEISPQPTVGRHDRAIVWACRAVISEARRVRRAPHRLSCDSDARPYVHGGERWSAPDASVAHRLSGGGWEFAFDSLAIRGSSEERAAAARRTVVRQDDTLLSLAGSVPATVRRRPFNRPHAGGSRPFALPSLPARAGPVPSLHSDESARPCQDCPCANYHEASRPPLPAQGATPQRNRTRLRQPP